MILLKWEKVSNFNYTVELQLGTRREAVTVYRSYYRAKFEYCLPITTFSKQQTALIEQPCINALLPKMGYNRHFPRALVFGPVQYGGLGIKNLYYSQGCQHMKWFLKVMRSDSTINPLLNILLRQTQMEAGTREPMLSARHKDRIISYQTPSWITCLGSFFRET